MTGQPTLPHVLIVGAGCAGIMVLEEIFRMQPPRYAVIGFVDDDEKKKNGHIYDLPILGTSAEIEKIVLQYNIEEIIIAIPSANRNQIRSIISHCKKTKATVKIVPGLYEIITGDVSIHQVREVNVDDLLGRETVSIDVSDVSSYVKDDVVFITGGAGSIGSELCKQIISYHPKQVIVIDNNENDLFFLQNELNEYVSKKMISCVVGDIKNEHVMKNVFEKYKPQVIFHAAAFKHVPLMESNLLSLVANNIVATNLLVRMSDKHKVKRFVFISTDKAVNPTSLMGASKRIGEMMIQSQANNRTTKYMAVRFGNVLGSKGSVIPLFRQQIEKGGPVTVTDPEVRRYFMSTKEAVELVLQAGAMGIGGEIFILDMGEQIKVVDLARDLIMLSGFEPGGDIPITFIGLRPGEKLSEEILLDYEKDQATKHDKIYISYASVVNKALLNSCLRRIEKDLYKIREYSLIEKIKKLVPSYTPTNNCQ